MSPSSTEGWEESTFSTWLELTKPRLSGLVLVTVAFGGLFAIGLRENTFVLGVALFRLFAAVIGVGLVSGGGAAMNMWIEREVDLLMERTKSRPIPSGKLQPSQVFFFGLVLTGIGLAEIFLLVGGWPANLCLFSWVAYVLIYTPLKRISTLNTLVGAVTGALPPLIGWLAVGGEMSKEAWFLFILLYAWQLPHFFAIAWIYREDYRAAGIRMLPVMDGSGRLTMRQILIFSVGLIPISLFPNMLGRAGTFYLFSALVLGIAQALLSLKIYFKPTEENARLVFYASIFYLPALLACLFVDLLFLNL